MGIDQVWRVKREVCVGQAGCEGAVPAVPGDRARGRRGRLRYAPADPTPCAGQRPGHRYGFPAGPCARRGGSSNRSTRVSRRSIRASARPMRISGRSLPPPKSARRSRSIQRITAAKDTTTPVPQRMYGSQSMPLRVAAGFAGINRMMEPRVPPSAGRGRPRRTARARSGAGRRAAGSPPPDPAPPRSGAPRPPGSPRPPPQR